MKKTNISVSRCLGVSFLLVVTIWCAAPARDSAWAPNRPIEFVVAAGPGGGSDLLARTVQSIIQKYTLIDGSVIVTNKGGGSGSEAFVYAKGSSGNPHKAVFATNNVWLLPDYIAADERWLRGQFAEDGWLVN